MISQGALRDPGLMGATPSGWNGGDRTERVRLGGPQRAAACPSRTTLTPKHRSVSLLLDPFQHHQRAVIAGLGGEIGRPHGVTVLEGKGRDVIQPVTLDLVQTRHVRA